MIVFIHLSFDYDSCISRNVFILDTYYALLLVDLLCYWLFHFSLMGK